MFLIKFLIALAASLAAANGQEARGAGWQAEKGGVVCVWTKGPDGRAECRCHRR